MNWKLYGYLKETRHPVYSAALILPFLCLYHAGTLALHTTHINGADALIIRILGLFSVHSMLASALVLVICFTVWQFRSGASWKIKPFMLLVYFLESVCFALILLFSFGWMNTHLAYAMNETRRVISEIVLFCGAGIYEELLFRGFLLGFLILTLSRLIRRRNASMTAAVLLGSLLFSLFHYIGPTGDPFMVGSFIQRMVAGLYFSVLFLTRGFGVTAAAHATYDIFVGIINT